jgi:hypothetical protein
MKNPNHFPARGEDLVHLVSSVCLVCLVRRTRETRQTRAPGRLLLEITDGAKTSSRRVAGLPPRLLVEFLSKE